MKLLVFAGLVGILGPGPFSAASAADEEGQLSIEYNRFVRCFSSTMIRVAATGDAVRDGEFRLSLDRTFFTDVEIQQVVPPPIRVESSDSRMVYVFRVLDASQSPHNDSVRANVEWIPNSSHRRIGR
jgi:hypothetical protein